MGHKLCAVLLCALSSLSLWTTKVHAVGGACVLPDAAEMEFLLTDAMQQLSPGEVQLTLLDFNFTCLTASRMKGFYTFLTASVLFQTGQFPDPERAFFDVGCRNLNPDVWDVRVNQARNSIRGNGSDAELRSDCGVCANPDIIPASLGLEFDEETHCYPCDPACLQSGLSLCTGLSENLCCNVYDNDVCEIECPLNKEPDENFDCQCINNFIGRDCLTCGLDCQNGGTPNENCTACFCPANFSGVECRSDVDECLSSPCLNGTCVNLPGSFRCMCDDGFTGELCETEINACESFPCLNGGTCSSERGQFTCTCPIDFTGITCETVIDDCDPDLCLNGATCQDGIGDFTCLCSGNFAGRLCGDCDLDNCVQCSVTTVGVCLQCRPGYFLDETSTCVSECVNSPCGNGGTCTNSEGGIVCICQLGFTGDRCQESINFCESDPCANGGTCEQQMGGFLCVCSGLFSGITCETCDFILSEGQCILPCSTFPCNNGGTCDNSDDGRNFTCNCPPGITGRSCDTCIEENQIIVNSECMTDFIQTCQASPELLTDDEVNNCIYEGVTRQWSLLTGIQILPQVDNREAYFHAVGKWEELARENGLNVGPSSSDTDLTDAEEIWRADMEAWLTNFEAWAAYVKSLKGEAPAVPQVDFDTQDTQAIYDTLNQFWSNAVQQFDPIII